MLHGPQRGAFDLTFEVPSRCADLLRSGDADIGIVPTFELTCQDLEIIPGTGIACRGPVRSILLVSSRPANTIRSLAVDSSSRTSIQLARVILERRYGVFPEFRPHEPRLEEMLRDADAALIIGDPALRIDPSRLPYHVYDLGAEWLELTHLPMVFAVWAGRQGIITPGIVETFQASYLYGRDHLNEIIAIESARREFPPELVEQYLTHHIVHELQPRDLEGMELFLNYSRTSQPA